MGVYLFDVPAFFILFRETLESAIILSVLLGFIDKLMPADDEKENAELQRRLKRQVWLGTLAGLLISVSIGAIFIIVFYTVASNLWEKSGPLWEGIFCLIACIVITVIAFGMIRADHWKKKWEKKLKSATESHVGKYKDGEKWALFMLPLTVICREGLESFLFIAGIGFNKPASGLPIPVVTGILTGCLVGVFIYRGSHLLPLTLFFNIMTTFLLFIGAGLFSNSIAYLQEAGDGDDVGIAWKLNCCDPEADDKWAIANSIFGWRNTATIGTTVGYFCYWLVILVGLSLVYTKAKKEKQKDNQSIYEESGKDEIPKV